jgi:hypothetical protein
MEFGFGRENQMDNLQILKSKDKKFDEQFWNIFFDQWVVFSINRYIYMILKAGNFKIISPNAGINKSEQKFFIFKLLLEAFEIERGKEISF